MTSLVRGNRGYSFCAWLVVQRISQKIMAEAIIHRFLRCTNGLAEPKIVDHYRHKDHTVGTHMQSKKRKWIIQSQSKESSKWCHYRIWLSSLTCKYILKPVPNGHNLKAALPVRSAPNLKSTENDHSWQVNEFCWETKISKISSLKLV